MKQKEQQELSFGRRWAQRIGLALGGFGGQFPKTLVDTFTSVFLLTAVGINGVHLAGILFVAEIIDAISDYVMGIAIDATKSKLGKNRFWMLVSIPVTVIGLIALFSIPANTAYGVKLVWATVAYIIVTTGQTMVSVASNAIVPFLSFEPRERGILVSTKLIFSMCGSMGIAGVVSTVVNLTGGGDAVSSYAKAAVGIGLIFAVITAFSVATLREHDYEGNVKKGNEKSNPLKDLGIVLKTKNYRVLLVMGFLCMLVQIAMTNGAPFYAGYVLGDDKLTGSILMPIMGGSMVPMLLMGALTKRFQKRQIVTVGCIAGAVMCVVTMLVGGNGMLLSICSLLEGIGFGLAYVSFFTIQPDVVDEVAFDSGRVMAGLQAALAGFACNMGSAVAMSMVSGLVGVAGFVQDSSTQSEAVQWAIRAATFIIPAIAMLAILVAIRFYDLDGRYAEIRAALSEQATEPEA